MSQFMILLYDDPAQWQKVSPAEMQAAIQKYREWRDRPFTVDGKRLGEDAGRVMRLEQGKPRATDGPYSETKEVLGGYWMIQVKSKEEAVNWMKQCPAEDGDIIEIRQVYEMADFPADVQEALK